jgi:hypothetical protein
MTSKLGNSLCLGIFLVGVYIVLMLGLPKTSLLKPNIEQQINILENLLVKNKAEKIQYQQELEDFKLQLQIIKNIRGIQQ